jgi:RHS repeat-associated protein
MLPCTPNDSVIEPQVHRDPFFSLRRPSRSILGRVLADLLVRLLIVSTLPSNYQAAAALFPVSVLWPLVATEETAEATSSACIFETRVRGFEKENEPLFGLESSQAAESRRGYDLGYGGIASDRLLNAKARFYDPLYGRFISQDSFLGQIDDPPSLHRYFYANDRPTFFVDPTGHQSAEANSRETHDFEEWYQKFYGDAGRKIDQPVTVNEDHGPIGNPLFGAYEWVASTSAGKAAIGALAWANDKVEAIAKKSSIALGGITRDLWGYMGGGPTPEQQDVARHRDEQTYAFTEERDQRALHNTELTFKSLPSETGEAVKQVSEPIIREAVPIVVAGAAEKVAGEMLSLADDAVRGLKRVPKSGAFANDLPLA